MNEHVDVLRRLVALLPPEDILVRMEVDTGTRVKLVGFLPPWTPVVTHGMTQYLLETIGRVGAKTMGGKPEKDVPFATKRWQGLWDAETKTWIVGLIGAEESR